MDFLLVALTVAALLVAARTWWLYRRSQRLAHSLRLAAGRPAANGGERTGGLEEEIAALGRSARGLEVTLAQERRDWQRERLERETLLASISDGVALIDSEDRILHANRAFGSFFRLAVPPTPGSALSDVLRSPEILDIVRSARGSATPVEREIRQHGGEASALEARATNIDTEMEGSVLLVLRDLTERERQIRIRQDFVANVSHELRTPLTSIRGYAETLLDGGLEDETNRQRFVAVIREQATRLQTLVEDLLSLAEMERAGSDLRLTRFDLRTLAHSQIAAFRERARARKLSLVLEEGPPVEVLADRSRLEQVFANLLDNALKYTEKGGVKIELGSEPGHIWAAVEDTGIGIPASEQARIFERFYRVDEARSREMGGTGLGLSIVKHILARHHGEIRVENASGGGSRFVFRLPR